MAGLGRPGPGPRAAMPAWKREILERKRAKLAALGTGPGPGAAPAGPDERLVLAESLGPLRENPFMRLESERRRGARPAQQLLELYRRVPGVRTIRADNILIIESAPGFPPAAPGEPGRLGVGAGPVTRRSDFLKKTGSNSFTVHPRGLARGVGTRSLSNGPADPEPLAGPANGLAGSPTAPGEWKPKVESGEPSLHPPPSPGTPSATTAAPPAFCAPSSASATSTPSHCLRVSAAASANNSFEIRPAPKPDMETIPLGDLQARALASLRVNSRNSFVFIPKRNASRAPLPQGKQLVELPKPEMGWASQSEELRAQLVSGGDGVPALRRSPSRIEVQWAAKEGGCPRPAITLTDRSIRWQRPSSPPPCLPVTAEAEPAESLGIPSCAKDDGEHSRPGLPITFIDEVDSEEEAPQEAKLPCSGAEVPLQYHLHRARPEHSSELQHRGSNTFTVVPKRKTGALQMPQSDQANGEPPPRKPEEKEAGSLSGSFAALGTTLKKRYPTVHEIEVIGGYLALQKSCLTKAGSSRKKMKISFNDKSLQTTFEYPSESSLVQEEEVEAEEEEEEEGEEGEEDDERLGSEEKPFTLFLPRATFVSGVGPESLSSYTPKHSMAFSKWQEQTLVQAPREAEPPPKEVMLTPASQNDLSDFRSEPALYF
uniref:Taperin n=1 Tax=Ictidomys tridecemlineatus TaxID=43179 RepID=I3NEY6_ICTTR